MFIGAQANNMDTYYALRFSDNIKVVIPWKNKESKPTIEDFVSILQRQHYELQYVSQAGYETKDGGKSGPEISVQVDIDEVEIISPTQTHPAFV